MDAHTLLFSGKTAKSWAPIQLRWLVLSWALVSLSLVQATTAEDFALCDAVIATSPESREAVLCLYKAGYQTQNLTGSQERLEALLANHPGSPWIHFFLGHTFHGLRNSDPRVMEHYNAAIENFRSNPRGTPIGLAEMLSRRASIYLEWKGHSIIRCTSPDASRDAPCTSPQLAELIQADLNEAFTIAEPLANARMQAQIQLVRARFHRKFGKDLFAAYTALQRVEDQLSARDLPQDQLHLNMYSTLGTLAHELNRPKESRDYRHKHMTLAQSLGNRRSAVKTQFNLALSLLTDEPTEPNRHKAVQALEDVLPLLRPSGYSANEAYTHYTLGKLKDGAVARQHLETCVEIGGEIGDRETVSLCRARLAYVLADAEPAKAAAALGDSSIGGIEGADPRMMLYGWSDRLRAIDRLAGDEERDRFQDRVLRSFEALRSAQQAESGRTRFLSAWTDIHERISGRILQDLVTPRAAGAASPSALYPAEPELARAFEVLEQRRARSLLETIGRPENPDRDDAMQARKQLSARLQQQMTLRLLTDTPSLRENQAANLEQLLTDLGLTPQASRQIARDPDAPNARALVQHQQQLWRRDEDRLRSAIAMAEPRGSRLDAEVARLHEVLDTLDKDDALLIYQLGWWRDIYGDFGGGSWLLVLTSEGLRIYPLPDRGEIENAAQMVLLMDEPDQDAPASLARLYRLLLEQAILDLPPSVDRLHIVPDGQLHRLPFDALRPATVALPLGDRFTVSTALSATLWQKWHRQPKPRGRVPALVLADPLTDRESGFWRWLSAPLAAIRGSAPSSTHTVSFPRLPGEMGDTFHRSDPLDGLTSALSPPTRSLRTSLLEPLPGARQEARAIRDILGPDVEVWIGDDASETRLRDYNLQDVTMLHLATHALVDEERPNHLAILLAGDTPDRHALLTAEEVESLDLHGKVVVLSTCESAAGSMIRGEGILSLARVFFSAGAHTVIASRKPLDDDEAASLFTEIYRELKTGHSVAEAVRQAKKTRRQAGTPFSTWANVVVLGDGDAVPFPVAER